MMMDGYDVDLLNVVLLVMHLYYCLIRRMSSSLLIVLYRIL